MRKIWLSLFLIPLLLGTSSAWAQDFFLEKQPANEVLRTAKSLAERGLPDAETGEFRRKIIETIDEWLFLGDDILSERLSQMAEQGIELNEGDLMLALYRALEVVSSPREAIAKMHYDLGEVKTTIADPLDRKRWLFRYWDAFAEAYLASGETHHEVVRELLDGYRRIASHDAMHSIQKLRNRAMFVALCFMAESNIKKPELRAELRAITDQVFPEWRMFTDQSRLSARSIESTAFLIAFVHEVTFITQEAETRWKTFSKSMNWGQNKKFWILRRNYSALLASLDESIEPTFPVEPTAMVDLNLFRDLFRNTLQGIEFAVHAESVPGLSLPPGFLNSWKKEELLRINSSPQAIISLMDEGADLGMILGGGLWDFVRTRLDDEEFADSFFDWMWEVEDPSQLPPFTGPREPFASLLEGLLDGFFKGMDLDSSSLMGWVLKLAPADKTREYLNAILLSARNHELQAYQNDRLSPPNGIQSLTTSAWLHHMIERAASGEPGSQPPAELRFLNDLFFESGLILSSPISTEAKFEPVLNGLFMDDFWALWVNPEFQRANPELWNDPRMPQWQEQVSGYLERRVISFADNTRAPLLDREQSVKDLIDNAAVLLHDRLYIRFLKRIHPKLKENSFHSLHQLLSKEIAGIERLHAEKIDTRAQCLELMLRFNPN